MSDTSAVAAHSAKQSHSHERGTREPKPPESTNGAIGEEALRDGRIAAEDRRSVMGRDMTPELNAFPTELEASDNRVYEPLGTVVVFQLSSHAAGHRLWEWPCKQPGRKTISENAQPLCRVGVYDTKGA